MNIYVETNFVLELALEQEECDTCAEIIRLASAGQLRLVVPAFRSRNLITRSMVKPRADRAWEKTFAPTSANSEDPDAIVRFRLRSMHWLPRSSPALNLSVRAYDEQSRS
jgi:hypothetical protein